jgi:hypothetical protein
MAIAAILDFPGGTLEQYDQVIDAMGLKPGGDGPPGAIFHWVARTDDGIRVVDVWETREHFDRFAQDEIGPKTQAAGLAQPQMVFYDVHNTLGAVPAAAR